MQKLHDHELVKLIGKYAHLLDSHYTDVQPNPKLVGCKAWRRYNYVKEGKTVREILIGTAIPIPFRLYL